MSDIFSCISARTKINYSNVRGIWITTAFGLDWPDQSSNVFFCTSFDKMIKLQKKSLIEKLDRLSKIGFNTIFFQVKPDGTSLYRSRILPWSNVLTGKIGKDPGYDPLEFIIMEAHKRNLKIHAWINPYRVSTKIDSNTVLSLKNTAFSYLPSVYIQHNSWVKVSHNQFVLDPGLPEVRSWIVNIVEEIVKFYDVDGIQFDDYFYYEDSLSRLKDDDTYHKYSKNQFSNKENWRRNNTFLLIKDVYKKIHSIKPNVSFGVSPTGIWRNVRNDPFGSQTNSLYSSYDSCYADVKLWIKTGILDYVIPQIYWSCSDKTAKYDILIKWWANLIKTSRTKLCVGLALYKAGIYNPQEPEWFENYGITEISKQLDLSDDISEIQGIVFFRESFLASHSRGSKKIVEYLQYRWNR
ncbi:glycoside hydrolase family 10 protein [Candidatus Riesia pediculischaeffi]|uniref:Putative glycoside hydrolase n=1 Tax=Candidatus Riesia pediculischaeffi PTSU TaxID=1401651 RepID=A0A0C1V670_9ENTR|nr:family 10 glycosylhydrolase [Candidatus Riesia pediculischaeffi]KIE63929.1 putative glycoside hydrolase [Candidatus Riesia pediculischaeffi PTSU]